MAAAKLGRGYIEVAALAESLGWRTERMRRWLMREDALIKKGRYYYTTKSRLLAAFPEVFEELFLGGGM
jgi:hypothetical protein